MNRNNFNIFDISQKKNNCRNYFFLMLQDFVIVKTSRKRVYLSSFSQTVQDTFFFFFFFVYIHVTYVSSLYVVGKTGSSNRWSLWSPLKGVLYPESGTRS